MLMSPSRRCQRYASAIAYAVSVAMIGGPASVAKLLTRPGCIVRRKAKACQRRLEYEDQREHRQQHGQNRNIDSGVVPGLDPGRDRRLFGLQRHLKNAVLGVSDTRLIGDDSRGATLAEVTV